MPLVSKAQQRFMFANHPGIAKRWAALTDFSHLPERKKKRRPMHEAMVRAKNSRT